MLGAVSDSLHLIHVYQLSFYDKLKKILRIRIRVNFLDNALSGSIRKKVRQLQLELQSIQARISGQMVSKDKTRPNLFFICILASLLL